MRILLCGGGTAGHVYPAISISEIIKRNDSNSEFAYVVTEKGIENDIVKCKKYKINVCGLKRKAILSNIRAVYLTFKAIKESKRIIKDFKPDAVIGTGGYSCFPVIYAAHKMGVKTALHESNARPGKAAMALAPFLDLIMLNYYDSREFFGKHENVKVVGVPIREEFIKKGSLKEKTNGEINILCFGGSLGAEKINECAWMIVKEIILKRKNVNIVWGCGKREYQKCTKMLEEASLVHDKRIELKGYIENMPQVLRSSDIVICRAGAISISEMAYNGKCCVLVPSPNVADNHQFKNAQALEKKGAAVMVTEDKLENIIPVVIDLIENKNKRDELSNIIYGFFNRDSNKLIYNEIKKLI